MDCAGEQLASPVHVKSPPVQEPTQVLSPVGNRPKPIRRSWGFAAAANFAASLRQSFGGGESIASKQEICEDKSSSSSPASPPADALQNKDPAAEPVLLENARISIEEHTHADAPPNGAPEAAVHSASKASLIEESSEDPLSPVFRPLSSGLELMQAEEVFQEPAGQNSASNASHAADLEALQKQARLHAQAGYVTQSAPESAAGTDTALSCAEDASSASNEPVGSAAEESSQSQPESIAQGEGEDLAAATAGAASSPADLPSTASASRLATGSHTRASASSSMARQTGQSRAAQETAPAVVKSPDTESTPIRLMTRAMNSMKIQSVTPAANADPITDEPESPSPLRDGLAFMTPLSAFDPDASPQPDVADLTDDHDSQKGTAVGGNADKVLPRMQPLEGLEKDGASGVPDNLGKDQHKGGSASADKAVDAAGSADSPLMHHHTHMPSPGIIPGSS